MTKERLDEIVVGTDGMVWFASEAEGDELIRLARLGLWAEEYGRRALDFIIEESNSEEAAWNEAVRARNALPKEASHSSDHENLKT